MYSITQDSNGFIWLIGQHGLLRFDGYNTIRFSSTSTWSVPFTWAHAVEKDQSKFIVATEESGSWHFDPQTGVSEPLKFQTPKNFHYQTLRFQDKYYTYSLNNVYEYDPATRKTQSIMTTDAVYELAKTKELLFINGKDKGLYSYNNTDIKRIYDGPVKKITTINDYVIVLTPSTLISFKGNEKIAETNIPPNVTSLVKAFNSDNFFTISSSGKINKYVSKTLELLKHGFSDAGKGRVISAFHDSSNVLWIASNFGVQTLTESKIINHPIVYDITYNANQTAYYQNEILIASYGNGLQRFSSEYSVLPEEVNNRFTKKALRTMDTVSIEGNLYIATFDGLWKFSGLSKQLERVNFPSNDKLLLQLTYQDGLLYIGSNYDGLYVYDVDKGHVIDHVTTSEGILSNEITDILSFNDGATWLSNTDGISIYNRYTKFVKNIPAHGNSKFISLIRSKDKIFAATMGDGIYIYNKQGELLSKIAEGIQFDRGSVINDEIWIGSSAGLYTIDPFTYDINLIPSTEKYSFSGQGYLHNGKVFLAHYGGVLEVPVERSNEFNAKVHVSKTTVSGVPYLLNHKATLSSSNDVVNLDLVSLDYRPGQDKKI